jgi:hypothetical protein
MWQRLSTALLAPGTRHSGEKNNVEDLLAFQVQFEAKEEHTTRDTLRFSFSPIKEWGKVCSWCLAFKQCLKVYAE